MKKLALIDQLKNGDQFETLFDSIVDAIDGANKEWKHLSTHDKNRRKAFFVVKCKVDEEGCVDLNMAEIIYTIKYEEEN